MTPNPQQHVHDIDAALDSLRAAHPVPGNPDEAFAAMHARLLHNLRASADRNHALQPGWLSLPRLGFAAAALAAVWIGALLLPVLRSSPSSSAAVKTRGALSVTAFSPRVGSAGRQSSAYQPAQHEQMKRPPVVVAALSSISSRGRSAEASSKTGQLDPAFLPSSPAPEEPLTHQERLLQKMANHHKPMMLALLELNQPDLSTLRQPSGPNPLFAGFQPEPQSVAQADAPGTQSADPSGSTPQPEF